MATASLFPSSFVALLALFSLLPPLSASRGAGGASGGTSSFRDLLLSYGLPAGLLPKAVESFALDADSGLLEVQLTGPCYAIYDGVLAYFDSVVRGNLSYGELGGVDGWSQEELFVWLPVKGILIADPSSGVVIFDIGLAHKQLPASVFEDPPECSPAAEAIAAAGEELRGRKRHGFQQQR